jgi:hypothetical protein
MAMYNRYIPSGTSYTRITENDPTEIPHTLSGSPGAGAEKDAEEKKGLSAILKSLKLDDLDTGDVLILLILLFLFLEGDDIEMMITLGLMLLLGLD